MSQIITDKKLIEEVLSRGVEKIYPSRGALEKKLLSGEKIKLYCGYDPTSPSLQVGNAVTLNKLAQFQALGHEIVFLIGDFTCMIGDPTDKKAVRFQMTREEVLNNARDYQKQAAAYLKFTGDNPVRLKYNSVWNDQLNFVDLIKLAANFTVQQMVQRDMFQKRIQEEKPIYLHEFLYPLVQAYDSVALDIDLEIGGNDQMFNMMCGRTLLKTLKNKEKFVMTLKLLADDEGKKMGKSEGNAVFFNEEPNNIYGQIMSWPDGAISTAFELCTNLPMSEIAKMMVSLKDKELNPRDLKMKLAYELTRIIGGGEKKGAQAAQSAQEHFVNTIQNKELPEMMDIYLTAKPRQFLVDLLVETKLVKSKTEGRQKITEGAIKVKMEKKMATNSSAMVVMKDVKQELEFGSDIDSIIIQKGKFNFVRVRLN
ncbi:MAG: tyrosine--tRNA ligase [Patescibacteria group bacterium]